MDANQTRQEWLKKISVGEKVVITGGAGKTIGEVCRLTSTQIIVLTSMHNAKVRFRKKDGYRVAADTWDFSNIVPWSPYIEGAILHEKLAMDVYTIFSRIRLSSLRKMDSGKLTLLMQTLREYHLIKE